MPGSLNKENDVHDIRASDAQALLLSIGSAPIDPVLPGQAAADEADRCMALAAATPEYAALSERRMNGEIDGEAFASGLMTLLQDLSRRGAFDPEAELLPERSSGFFVDWNRKKVNPPGDLVDSVEG